MPLDLVTIPCLADNYAFLLHNTATGETLLVDVPEAPPVLKVLDTLDWTLSDIVLTHHHDDHVQGLAALRRSPRASAARVIGARADAHRLPALDLEVSEGESLTLCGEPAEVFDVSGHTLGHIAVYSAAARAVFSADSLMALGCGRLFEGTPAQMWQSLQKLRALPDDTRVCSGHEYTQTNARFALTIEPENQALTLRIDEINRLRRDGHPTVPSTLGEERATNPFLRADHPELHAALSMIGADPAEVFAHVRKRRDTF